MPGLFACFGYEGALPPFEPCGPDPRDIFKKLKAERDRAASAARPAQRANSHFNAMETGGSASPPVCVLLA